MIRRILIALLLPLPLLAQTTVRGIVTEQNSGNRPVPGVQIKALGSAPELSDNAGGFRLAFAAKKPGDRIVVTGIEKAGYELVNRDILTNWVILSDAQATTKIVMCPEGALARNMARYYDISLAALTRGYNEQLRRLQEERDGARIDAAAYGARAQLLAARFENQQKQLEDLAERFARENFDDCSAVQHEAFAAFSAGNVEEAIRILESVNSEEEIAKAKAQREKSNRLEGEVRQMRVESDSIIRQHVRKLRFQADLYLASNRFEDAARAYEAMALADTTDFRTAYAAVEFFDTQRDRARAHRWCATALRAARRPLDSVFALIRLAGMAQGEGRRDLAERHLALALDLSRRAVDEDPYWSQICEAQVLSAMADTQDDMARYARADSSQRKALVVHRLLMARNRAAYGKFVVTALLELGELQCVQNRCDSAEAFIREALDILRTLPDSTSLYRQKQYAEAYSQLGAMYFRKAEYHAAEEQFAEALRRYRGMAATNPEAFTLNVSGSLGDLANCQTLAKNYEASERNQLESLAITETLVARDPQQYVPQRIHIRMNLGGLYNAWGRYDRAIEYYRAAIADVTPLAVARPGEFGQAPAAYGQALGTAYWHAGQRDSAERCFAEALRNARDLHASNPQRYTTALFNSLIPIAEVVYREQPERAIAYAKEGLELVLPLLGGPVNMRNTVAATYRFLAKYAIIARDNTAAERYARQAIDVLPISTARRYLAASLLYQGRFEEAKALYLEMRDAPVPDRRTYRDLFLEDFTEFERAGITHPDVANIRVLLGEGENKP